MDRARGILLHISVICSLICITTGILDYYNPYMDFAGHTVAFRFILYGAVIVLEATRRDTAKQDKSKKVHHPMLKNFNLV